MKSDVFLLTYFLDEGWDGGNLQGKQKGGVLS